MLGTRSSLGVDSGGWTKDKEGWKRDKRRDDAALSLADLLISTKNSRDDHCILSFSLSLSLCFSLFLSSTALVATWNRIIRNATINERKDASLGWNYHGHFSDWNHDDTRYLICHRNESHYKLWLIRGTRAAVRSLVLAVAFWFMKTSGRGEERAGIFVVRSTISSPDPTRPARRANCYEL